MINVWDNDTIKKARAIVMRHSFHKNKDASFFTDELISNLLDEVKSFDRLYNLDKKIQKGEI